MKRKQFLNGVSQLAQEGAIQVYKQPYVMESFIIALSASCSSKS